MTTGTTTPTATRLKILQELVNPTDSHAGIATRYRVSESVVRKLARKLRQRGNKTLEELAVPLPRNGPPQKTGKKRSPYETLIADLEDRRAKIDQAIAALKDLN